MLSLLFLGVLPERNRRRDESSVIFVVAGGAAALQIFFQMAAVGKYVFSRIQGCSDSRKSSPLSELVPPGWNRIRKFFDLFPVFPLFSS